MINPADVAIAAVSAELLLFGKRKCNGRGLAEALPEGATAGVRGRSPDHYSRAGVTGGGDGRRSRGGRALVRPEGRAQ